MSKFFRRGSSQVNSETAGVSRSDHHPHHNHLNDKKAMATGASATTYASSTTTTANMQMDYNERRTSYTHERESRTPQSRINYNPQDTSDNRRHRSKSKTSRSSSRRSNQQSHHAQSSSGHMNYSSPQNVDNYQYNNGQTIQPPMTQYETDQNAASVTPGPPDIQSNYPAHVSSSQSQQSSASQRRPAYLLHRDLVIGKGSYGQVCIASRGEAEGHISSSSGGGAAAAATSSSGKRKKFACKCVVLRNDAKYIAKLQEEVNVLRELRGHENVIRLYDVFCVDNELFIITELGRGGDLFHLLTTHPKHGVTEAYAAKTVSQMLSSVAFLHSKSICHRDLKLENWVLESGRDVWSPLKLIDFGLSTHFTPGHRLSRVVGSSYYVAPEVLKKSYTEACDLWSLGVIVYMLLSGAPPFYGKNDEAIKGSIVQGEYTFPHELFRDVSDEAMAFVSTLLSYNIEYRYTAEQALTHPWLAVNCDPDILQRAKDGARGVGVLASDGGDIEPMQM